MSIDRSSGVRPWRRPSLRAPSFQLRKGERVVFSDSGRLLLQLGPRAMVWDVDSRSIVAQFKPVVNNSSAAISPDESVTAVKNTNGEIAFCETLTGKVISSTGAFKSYREGCEPRFSDDGRVLIDADWDGVIRLIEVATAKELDSRAFHNYMITGLPLARRAGKQFVTLNAKSGKAGGSRILVFPGLDLGSYTEIAPTEIDPQVALGWRDIKALATDPCAKWLSVAVACRTGGVDTPTIETFDMESGRSSRVSLPSRQHVIWGLTCSSEGVVVAAIDELLHRPGMSSSEWAELRAATEHTHLHFYDARSMNLLARWYWQRPYGVDFSPMRDALAVASSGEPGAYLAGGEFHPATAHGLVKSTRSRPITPAGALTQVEQQK